MTKLPQHSVLYEAWTCPATEEMLKTAIRVTSNEDFLDTRVQSLIEGIQLAYASICE